MLGFLNLDKPPGWTSHDCVAKIRRILKTKRVGHGGTLDPMATGVLPVAVGPATRLLPYLPEGKAYRALIKFGVTTGTDDVEGEILTSRPRPDLSLEEVERHLPRFIGTIDQVPPMYSAISVNGQRLYKLARRGETIDVPPRRVRIDAIEVLDWVPSDFPVLSVSIVCGGGTYIRSIARDLGEMTGAGATLAGLTRTSSCGMELTSSIGFEALQEAGEAALLPPGTVLAHLDSVILSDDEVSGWLRGRRLPVPGVGSPVGSRAVYSGAGGFLGIGEVGADGDSYELRPKVVFS